MVGGVQGWVGGFAAALLGEGIANWGGKIPEKQSLTLIVMGMRWCLTMKGLESDDVTQVGWVGNVGQPGSGISAAEGMIQSCSSIQPPDASISTSTSTVLGG